MLTWYGSFQVENTLKESLASQEKMMLALRENIQNSQQENGSKVNATNKKCTILWSVYQPRRCPINFGEHTFVVWSCINHEHYTLCVQCTFCFCFACILFNIWHSIDVYKFVHHIWRQLINTNKKIMRHVCITLEWMEHYHDHYDTKSSGSPSRSLCWMNKSL